MSELKIRNYSLLDIENQILSQQPKPRNKIPKIIDLFSGCGGLSLGFQLAGFDIISALDNWKCAVETYSANFNHVATLLDLSDITCVKTHLTPYFSNTTAAIIGGPPCQDFSSAGTRTEGEKANLTEIFAQIVCFFNPPFFVMENVPRSEKSRAFKNATSLLKNSHYTIVTCVLDASLCGVPQKRKRLITFGAKNNQLPYQVLQKLMDRQAPYAMTLRDWFGDRLNVETYYRHPRSYARRGVFSIDEPSPTIRGVNRPIPVGYPGHPGDASKTTQTRPLTTKERAEIQTFPQNFKFIGSRTDTEQMIGNAVPVNLAKYIASIIKECYEREPLL